MTRGLSFVIEVPCRAGLTLFYSHSAQIKYLFQYVCGDKY